MRYVLLTHELELKSEMKNDLMKFFITVGGQMSVVVSCLVFEVHVTSVAKYTTFMKIVTLIRQFSSKFKFSFAISASFKFPAKK